MNAKFIKPLHIALPISEKVVKIRPVFLELFAPGSTTKNKEKKTSAKYIARQSGILGGLKKSYSIFLQSNFQY